MWAQWQLVRCSAQKGIFEQGVGRGSGDERDRDVFGAPIFVTGKKASRVDGKLVGVAVQHFHRLVGMELPMKHFMIRIVKAGIARERALKGEPHRIRHQVS